MSGFLNEQREEILKSRIDGFRYYTLVKNEKGFTVNIGYRFYRVGIKMREFFFIDLRNALVFFEVRTHTRTLFSTRGFTEFSISGRFVKSGKT